MFQLLRYNPTEGKVNVLVEYEIPGGKSTRDERTFADEKSAAKWIHDEQRNYLVRKLQGYVGHKKVLSEVSDTWCTPVNKFSKLRSLSICRKEIDVWQNHDLKTVKKCIEMLYEHLVQILPEITNRTYSSSRTVLNDLWFMSQEEVKPISNASA